MTIQKYDAFSRTLHWLIVIAVFTMIAIGFSFGWVSGDLRATLMFIHKSTGMSILFLMIIRTIWRFTGMRKPKYAFDIKPMHKFAADVTHGFLYLCLFVMPLSGLVGSSLGGYQVPFWGINLALPLTQNKPLVPLLFDIHAVTVWILIGFISLHILGAIYHEIRKEKVIGRMV